MGMRWLVMAAMAAGVLNWGTAGAEDAAPALRWEKNIAAFEEADRANPPQEGAVLFVGSSTIVGWDLARDFPGLEALNRGFGGSVYSDVLQYVDRVVLPYRPKTVVLYSGDNDIAVGKSPEEAFADFEALVKRIHEELPETRILVLSIKPSKARWEMWDRMRQVNERLKAYADEHEHVTYVDIAAALVDDKGEPRPEFYQEDGLHLSAKGYEVCSELVRPLLESEEE